MVDGSQQIFHHDVQICIEIASDNRRQKSLEYAIKAGWPMKIDFACLVPRVNKMHKDLISVLSFEDALEDCPVWTAFLQENSNLWSFARDRERRQANIANARPG